VVDDVAVNQRLMSQILDKRGSPRTWPARGAGLEAFAGPLRLVLMDCHMRMDGFEHEAIRAAEAREARASSR